MAASQPTLRSQLLRGMLVPLSALLLVGVGISYFVIGAVTEDIYDGELSEIARELTLHVRYAGDEPAFDLSQESERTLLLDDFDKIYYAVRTEDGRAIAGEPELPRAGAVRREMTYGNGVFAGQPVRIAALRVAANGRPGSHAVVIEVAETLVKRDLLTRKLLLGFALPQVLLILVAGALLWLGVGRGLAPLQRLRGAVAERSHLDMSPIEMGGVPGEVRPLAVAVNDLMGRLGAVLDFQGRFIADAAHQLRTPVAGLKAHIEVALREQNLEQMKRGLAHLYISAERLSRLVAQLLSLARNEPSTARLANFAPLDFNKLAFEATMEWVADAYKKKIDLGFEGAERPVVINGDPARLTELVNNLVDNAVRYTHEGGRVTVKVSAGARPRVSVSDDGPKIPVEERERVFERFHRLLDNRTEEGSGLGLAIVREIAALHEADISLVEDIDGVGNTFTVTFPGMEESSTPLGAA